MTVKHLDFNFKVKKAAKGTLTIEGLANANTIDRMKERIVPSAWNLENYKKNPVVLFDHGKDPTFGVMPIGRAIAVEPRDEGLYTKIEISGSKSEKITAVRDLIEEGILKCFSVGFEPKETQKGEGDVIEITKAELLETSVVPIPMNQDSTFSLLAHRKSYWHSAVAKRWYDAFLAKVAVIKKGAWVAAAVNQRLFDMLERGDIRDKESVLKFVAGEAECELSRVRKVLAGDLKKVPDNIISAFSVVLKIDKGLLDSLNQGDQDLFDRVLARDDQGEAMAAKTKKPKGKKSVEEEKPKADEKPKDEPKEEPKDEEGAKAEPISAPQGVICCVTVSKEQAESAEQAASMISEAGYAVDMPEETDQGYVFWQKPKEDVSAEEGIQIELGSGVSALVAPLKEGAKACEDDKEKSASEGKDGDGEKQMGEGEEDPEEDPEEEPEAGVDEEAAKGAYAKFQEERKATNEGGEGNPASWVADEDKWEKAKEMAKAAGADDIYAFAMWAYLNVLDGGKKGYTGPMGQKGVDVGDDNPYLELSRAGNATLGAILHELKGMNGKLDGLADLSVAKAAAVGSDTTTVETEGEGKDELDAKSLDLLRTFTRNLDLKLKKLNV